MRRGTNDTPRRSSKDSPRRSLNDTIRRSSTALIKGPSTRRADKRLGSLGIEVCDICQNCFYSKMSLSVHKRIHLKDFAFPCDVCNMEFPSTRNLRLHKKTHAATQSASTKNTPVNKKADTKVQSGKIESLKCKTCGRLFQKGISLANHNRWDCGSKKPRVPASKSPAKDELRCGTCKKVFKSEKAYEIHVKYRHDKGKSPTKATVAKVLKASSKSVPSHGKSKKRKMSLTDDESEEETEDDTEADTETPPPLFQCEECLATFRSKTSLNNHKRKHSNAVSSKSKERRSGVSKTDALGISKPTGTKTRQTLSKSKPKTVTKSTSKGSPKNTLKKNVGSIAKTNVKNTSKSGTRARSNSYVKTKIINTPPRFKCDVCKQVFINGTSLSNHMRKHNRDPKLKAQSSLKRSTGAGSKKATSDDTKHECDICGKCFSSQTSTKSHRNNHFKIKKHNNTEISKKPDERCFPCDTCGNSFRNVSALIRHRKMHRTERGGTPGLDKCRRSFVLVEKLDDKLLGYVSDDMVTDSPDDSSCKDGVDEVASGEKQEVITGEDTFIVCETKTVPDVLVDREELEVVSIDTDTTITTVEVEIGDGVSPALEEGDMVLLKHVKDKANEDDQVKSDADKYADDEHMEKDTANECRVVDILTDVSLEKNYSQSRTEAKDSSLEQTLEKAAAKATSEETANGIVNVLDKIPHKTKDKPTMMGRDNLEDVQGTGFNKSLETKANGTKTTVDVDESTELGSKSLEPSKTKPHVVKLDRETAVDAKKESGDSKNKISPLDVTLENDDENPELKGIIEFINNDFETPQPGK